MTRVREKNQTGANPAEETSRSTLAAAMICGAIYGTAVFAAMASLAYRLIGIDAHYSLAQSWPFGALGAVVGLILTYLLREPLLHLVNDSLARNAAAKTKRIQLDSVPIAPGLWQPTPLVPHATPFHGLRYRVISGRRGRSAAAARARRSRVGRPTARRACPQEPGHRLPSA